MSDLTGGSKGEFDDDPEPDDLGAAATLPMGREERKSRGGGRLRLRSRAPKVGLGLGSLLVVGVLIVLAVVPLAYSSLKKTPRDKVGISYGGGPFEGSHYQRIVQPGSTLFFNGWFDPLYLYPADQQNYIISKTSGQGVVKKPDSVIAPTSDRVPAEYQVAAYFKLNVDKLRAFHEQLGLKYRAYTATGWVNLLQDTFRQQIESALQLETRRYTVNDLIGSAEVLIKIQDHVQQTITEQLRLALGQQFFCGPTYHPGGKCGPITFVIKKIDIPDNVQNAFNAIQQRTNEAKSIEVLNVALRQAGQNYVLLRAVESGVIKLYVVPEGTDVAIQTAPDAVPTGTAGTAPSVPSAVSGGVVPGSTTTTTTPSSSTTTPSSSTTTPSSSSSGNVGP